MAIRDGHVVGLIGSVSRIDRRTPRLVGSEFGISKSRRLLDGPASSCRIVPMLGYLSFHFCQGSPDDGDWTCRACEVSSKDRPADGGLAQRWRRWRGNKTIWVNWAERAVDVGEVAANGNAAVEHFREDGRIVPDYDGIVAGAPRKVASVIGAWGRRWV